MRRLNYGVSWELHIRITLLHAAPYLYNVTCEASRLPSNLRPMKTNKIRHIRNFTIFGNVSSMNAKFHEKSDCRLQMQGLGGGKIKAILQNFMTESNVICETINLPYGSAWNKFKTTRLTDWFSQKKIPNRSHNGQHCWCIHRPLDVS